MWLGSRFLPEGCALPCQESLGRLKLVQKWGEELVLLGGCQDSVPVSRGDVCAQPPGSPWRWFPNGVCLGVQLCPTECSFPGMPSSLSWEPRKSVWISEAPSLSGLGDGL